MEGTVAQGSELDRFAAWHLRAWDDAARASWTTVNGTLCFVDISGFTALSEKLATLGRVGAEELTEVLNRVFGDMLGLAAERGGTLLKYGGDALLLLFEGTDHAVQAASATVEMRSALRKAADIPTSVGRVALRMSQGVHSGEVHLFRAQGSHAELIVAGPAASHVTEMEGTAEAGEILVSRATRDLLPADAVGAAKGHGWLLRWRTSKVPPCGHPPFSSSTSKDIASLIPTGLRSFLSAGSPDSEHRQATVAFVKIIGIDGLLAGEGPGPTATALDEVTSTIMAIADEEEVTFLATDVDHNACKVILVAGVPTTRVDEEGRMLRVARRIADLDTLFTLKIGVNRGDVFSGEVGSSLRSTYTVMGDTVNLAARLMAAAPNGSILSTASVLNRSRTVFETSEVEPFHVKGKQAPVRALRVGVEIGTRSVHEATTPFVGRDVELRLLRSAVEARDPGSGSCFTVVGATGIGKTRLVHEAVEGLAVPAIEVRAEPYGSANPYRPWRDTMRELLGVGQGSEEEMARSLLADLRSVAPHLLAMAPLLGDLAHIEVDPTPETEAIEGRFRQIMVAEVLLDLLAVKFPGRLVILAEDLHWADAASGALLDRLAVEAPQRAWTVLATSRDGVVQGSEVIDLEPMSDNEVSELVHRSTETTPLRPDVIRVIVERAGGNPLFVEELLGIVRETGDVLSLPTSLDGVVGSQIDSLPLLSRRVLRYLSVLGRSFRRSVANEMLRDQGIALDDATRATLQAFLDDDGPDRIQFRHAMVRDVAYEGLSFRLRRELHLAAGGLLLDEFSDALDGVAGALAFHFSLGGDAERTWHWGRIAGEKSLEIYANAEAETQFERALEATRRLATVSAKDRFGVWLELGDVRRRAGNFQGALEAYRRAGRLAANDPIARAEAGLRCARAKERAASYSDGLRETTMVRKLLDEGSGSEGERLRARALSFAAVIRQAQQRPKEALEAARIAADYASQVGDDIALADAWRVMDYGLLMVGDLESAHHSERALEIYRDAGDLREEASTASNLGAFAYWRGDWDAAISFYEQGRDVLLRTGNMVDAAVSMTNIAEVLVDQGRYEEAMPPLEDARRILLASGVMEIVGGIDRFLGRAYASNGDLEQAAEVLERSMHELEEAGSKGDSFGSALVLADVRCRLGAPGEALELIERAQQDTPDDYVDYFRPLAARVRGSILKSLGRSAEAVEVFGEGMRMALDRGDTYQGSLLALAADATEGGCIDPSALDRARETLHSLGVRSVSRVFP